MQEVAERSLTILQHHVEGWRQVRHLLELVAGTVGAPGTDFAAAGLWVVAAVAVGGKRCCSCLVGAAVGDGSEGNESRDRERIRDQ